MPATAERTLVTTEELLAMPENGIDRWLIRGQLKERPKIVRNRFHSRVMIRVGQLLLQWLDHQPAPRGQVYGGEVDVVLRRDPDTTVGVDVAYVSADVAARLTDETTLVDGVPVLAVVILSPSDTPESIHEKVDLYRSAGVPLIWIVDPADRTVRVYRPGSRPILFNEDQDLIGDPLLPGFRVAVSRLFE